MSGIKALAISALVVLAAFGFGSAAYAEPVACELTPLVSVDTKDQQLQQRICKIVASALPILQECHLKLELPVTIGFSDSLEASGGIFLGLFQKGQNQIDLLNPDTFEEAHKSSELWTSIPLSQHYDSIVVHEFTHALFDQSAQSELLYRVDLEYISYAMQLASLPALARNAFLADVGVLPPISVDGINQVILSLAPSVFAASAWLHFSEPGNGCEFVGKLVRGESTLWVYPE